MHLVTTIFCTHWKQIHVCVVVLTSCFQSQAENMAFQKLPISQPYSHYAFRYFKWYVSKQNYSYIYICVLEIHLPKRLLPLRTLFEGGNIRRQETLKVPLQCPAHFFFLSLQLPVPIGNVYNTIPYLKTDKQIIVDKVSRIQTCPDQIVTLLTLHILIHFNISSCIYQH